MIWLFIAARCISVVLLVVVVRTLLRNAERDRALVDVLKRQVLEHHRRIQVLERDAGLDGAIDTWRKPKGG